jgi:hypothetical protein
VQDDADEHVDADQQEHAGQQEHACDVSRKLAGLERDVEHLRGRSNKWNWVTGGTAIAATFLAFYNSPLWPEGESFYARAATVCRDHVNRRNAVKGKGIERLRARAVVARVTVQKLEKLQPHVPLVAEVDFNDYLVHKRGIHKLLKEASDGGRMTPDEAEQFNNRLEDHQVRARNAAVRFAAPICSQHRSTVE